MDTADRLRTVVVLAWLVLAIWLRSAHSDARRPPAVAAERAQLAQR